MWRRGNTTAKTTLLSECYAERPEKGDVSLSWCGLCGGTAIVSDAKPLSAEYYRQTAEEIRRRARQSQFPEIGEELSELADRFDRMAVAVERSKRASQESAAGPRGTMNGAWGPTGSRWGPDRISATPSEPRKS
jgi:hypothetical protein